MQNALQPVKKVFGRPRLNPSVTSFSPGGASAQPMPVFGHQAKPSTPSGTSLSSRLPLASCCSDFQNDNPFDTYRDRLVQTTNKVPGPLAAVQDLLGHGSSPFSQSSPEHALTERLTSTGEEFRPESKDYALRFQDQSPVVAPASGSEVTTSPANHEYKLPGWKSATSSNRFTSSPFKFKNTPLHLKNRFFDEREGPSLPSTPTTDCISSSSATPKERPRELISNTPQGPVAPELQNRPLAITLDDDSDSVIEAIRKQPSAFESEFASRRAPAIDANFRPKLAEPNSDYPIPSNSAEFQATQKKVFIRASKISDDEKTAQVCKSQGQVSAISEIVFRASFKGKDLLFKDKKPQEDEPDSAIPEAIVIPPVKDLLMPVIN